MEVQMMKIFKASNICLDSGSAEIIKDIIYTIPSKLYKPEKNYICLAEIFNIFLYLHVKI